ncbi:MAG TPA: cation transporter [Synergistaceae bacterium]|nr:cation transporter [Synergistaceae bacterium]
MSGEHKDAHHHDHSHLTEEDRIGTAFFLNAGFAIVELVGGFSVGSVAILSDAVHDLGDSVSLGLAWFLQRFSRKGKDLRFTYGYKRFSLLSALVNAIVLVSGSLFVLARAVPKFFSPEAPHVTGMFLLALFGVAVNAFAAFRLWKGSSINARVAAWHLLEDVLGWAAVLFVSVVLKFRPWYILDPLLSVLVSFFILWNVVKNLRYVLEIFLQGTPEGVCLNDIEAILLQIPGVISVHDLHVWSLDGERTVLTAHLVTGSDASPEEIEMAKNEARQRLSEKGIGHATLEMERKGEYCGMGAGHDCMAN